MAKSKKNSRHFMDDGYGKGKGKSKLKPKKIEFNKGKWDWRDALEIVFYE